MSHYPPTAALLHRRAALACALALPVAASAATCQPVRVPVAPGGLLVRLENGRAQGVVVDLVAALGRKLPCPVESELLPQGRLIQSFYETFQADVLIPGSPFAYEGHEPRFVPLFHVSAHFVGRRAAKLKAPDVATLLREDWTCVLARGVSYGADYEAFKDQLDAQRRVTWVRDVGTALRMVEADRVDFTLLSPTVVYTAVGAALYRRFQLHALPELRPLETGAAISRRSFPDAMQVQVVSALRALVKEGEVGRAFAKHFPAEVLEQEFLALPRALRPLMP